MTEETSTRHRIVSGHHGTGTIRSTRALGDFTGPTFEALGWAFSSIRGRRRLKRLIGEAGARVPIASAGEGVVRVEGSIETLDGVYDDGELVATFLRRTTRDEPCGCGDRCSAVKRFVTTFSESGRFLVRDDSGVAIVIGPSIRLLDYHGNSIDPFEAGYLSIRNDDVVTVIGTVTREAVDEPRARMSDGYRGTQLTPVFRNIDGDDVPVHVFCAPSA